MPHISIRRRLFTALLTIAMVPLLLIGLVLGGYTYQLNLDEAYARQQEIAHRVAVQAESYMQRFQLNMAHTLQHSSFATDDDASRHATMARLLNERELYREILYFDAAGNKKLHLSNVRLLDNRHHHPIHAPYKEPVNNVIKTGQTTRSLIYYDPENNEPLMLIAMPVHNVRDGDQAGTIIAEVRLKPVWNLISSLALNSGEDVYILGKLGHVIAHRNPSIVLRETQVELLPGQHRQTGLDGSEVLLAEHSFEIGQKAFRVIAERKIQNALQSAITNALILFSVILLTLIEIFILGNRLVRRITQPITAISETARAIREGDLERQADFADDDEIGEMAQTFNSMTSQLRQSLSKQERLNRAYLAIGKCNDAITHADNDIQLQQNICRIIQQYCGYTMVWIGIAEQDEAKTVRPVAISGAEQEYLNSVNISWSQDSQYGHGPAGTSIREQHAVIVQDIEHEPAFAPWLEQARKHGFAAAASFPMQSSDIVLGALMVYTSETNAFNNNEITLLSELAENTGFGLLKLRAEQELAKHRETLEELVEARTLELSHQQAFNNAVLENISDGIVACDANGTLSLFNGATREMHGLEQENLPPEKWAEHYRLYMPDGKTPLPLQDIPLYRAFKGEKVRHQEMVVQHALGSKRNLLASGQAMHDKDGNKIGAVISLHNITRQKVAETALIQAKEAAEAASEAKSAFLANMSHEIRTPMNAVLGLARMGVRDAKQGNNAQLFNKIINSGQHLLGVINDILDFSKIEAGKLKLESRAFSLQDVLDNVKAFVTNAAEEKGLSLSFKLAPDLPTWVEGDALRLSQILINLTSNAIKFTQHGEIKLLVARDGDEIHFVVADEGIGIDEETLARLFQPFEQADSTTTRTHGGTGLGLAISHYLVNMMGGQIEVTSQPGAGSNFYLSLPLPESTPPTAIARTVEINGPTGQRLQGIRILAAEDIEINRIILEDALLNEGAQVELINNGLQSVQRLENGGDQGFDIVLMDVQMPVMDGLEASRRISQFAPDLPIIGLTAHAMREEEEKCLAAGMIEHMSKPFDIDELVAGILRHVTVH